MPEDQAPEGDGSIHLCPHKGCGFRCCEFNQGNYIVLYPGEIEQAQADGHSLAHLDIFDTDYHGGARATCHAANTATCDNGYKPLDCATYPFFPTVGAKGKTLQGLLKGSKCPIEADEIGYHNTWARAMWARLIAQNPAVAEWLRHVVLVGYEVVEDTPEQAP